MLRNSCTQPHVETMRELTSRKVALSKRLRFEKKVRKRSG
jgi:hypothetical protein